MSDRSFTIAFFGLPLAALLLAHDGHHVALAALSRTDTPGRRRLRRLLGDARVIDKPRVNSAAFEARIEAVAPDLIVSWFWTTKLPMSLVNKAKRGGIGVHPSLLPRHRGPDPTTWAILAGDHETGVTVHRIEADYDTGAILAQERLAIDPSWSAWQLAKALDRPSLRALRATVARLSRGEDVRATPQDDALATEAPFLEDDRAAIRWSAPTAQILLQIRAFSPAPGAFTEVVGRAVVITRARAAHAYPEGLAPGEGAAIGDRAIVRTGDGAIELVLGEIDGSPARGEDFALLLRHSIPGW